MLVAARKECPLVVGRGDSEQFIGSAIPAFLAYTRRVQLIENGEIVIVRPESVDFLVAETGQPIIDREIVEVDWDAEEAEKGGYETFMLKEIHEQAERARRDHRGSHRPPRRRGSGRPRDHR